MTDRELLEALYRDMQTMKSDMQTMKSEMQTMKDQIQDVDEKVTRVELTLENETNHNIQLLAENHVDLVEKLNQAIQAQDKSILYEVQVSGLRMKVEKLEMEIAEIKSKIA